VLTILDRYVIRSFLYSYLVCLVALLGLSVVFDAFLRIRDFMEAAQAMGPSLGVLSLMVQYYSVRLPVIFHLISPAIMLTAAMFSMAQLNKNNELVPMRAAGISLYRTLVPLFIFAILITGVLVIDQEVLIPRLIPYIKEAEAMLTGAHETSVTRVDLDDESGNHWKIMQYERFEHRMKGDVLITSYWPGTAAVRTVVKAQTAIWKRSAADGVPRWHLSEGVENRYNRDGKLLSADEGEYNPRFGEDAYEVLRPGDKTADDYRIRSDLRPADVTRDDKSVLFASTSKLREHLATSPKRHDIAVALESRYAFPLSNLVLLLLGLPSVLGTDSKGTFGGLVICMVICAAFYGVSALCSELGKNAHLSPIAAAWLPIALFAPWGVFRFDSVRT
jgi:lipopolysaccharide export system permease protein